MEPVVPNPPSGGSTTIRGRAAPLPGCAPDSIQVFDCGPNRICYDGDDFPLPTVSATRDANGNFVIELVTPLAPRQLIYISDGCVDPRLNGPAILVPDTAAAPALSGLGMVGAAAMLGLLGLLAISRVRWARR
jgi:hypothetical protein